MKRAIILGFMVFLTYSISAQITTNFTINTKKDRQPISPYIYGSNGQSPDRDENITARRLGGNRMTSYNWENNFSNAGTDYINENDDYMPYALGLPNSQYLTPNSVLKAFHDTSIAMNCYGLLTLPMAGYVARDGAGVVTPSQTAPSSRWRQVVNQKGSAFSLTPDTTDKFVYVDECMNNLINKYGKSFTSTGVRGYEMDNEWALWKAGDSLMHPKQPTVGEAIRKAVALSSTIKKMDSSAEVFGPVDYGYTSFLSFQFAPDMSNYSTYGNFAYAFLHGMKHASDSLKHRLLDVFDVHWYSEAGGLDNTNTWQGVTSAVNDRGVAIARMEAPRTLWDSSYVENSWIGQYYSPCVYIKALQKGIDTYYPGTKLGFTEFGYGGEDHISGGIAVADVLGIFGKYGIYFGSIWGPINQYISSAYKIYRNYDGKNSTFGGTQVYASTNDNRTSSIYSSLQNNDSTVMNIIAMNKDYDSSLNASFTITANTKFTKADIYAFTSKDTLIHHIGSIKNISGNKFTYSIPKLSVYHFILSGDSVISAVNNENIEDHSITISPNPSSGIFTIRSTEPMGQKIQLTDLTGRVILSSQISSDHSYEAIINLQNQPSGVYLVHIISSTGELVNKLIKE